MGMAGPGMTGADGPMASMAMLMGARFRMRMPVVLRGGMLPMSRSTVGLGQAGKPGGKQQRDSAAKRDGKPSDWPARLLPESACRPTGRGKGTPGGKSTIGKHHISMTLAGEALKNKAAPAVCRHLGNHFPGENLSATIAPVYHLNTARHCGIDFSNARDKQRD